MTPLVAPFGYIGSGKFRQVPYQPIIGQIVDLTAEPGDGRVVLTWSKPWINGELTHFHQNIEWTEPPGTCNNRWTGIAIQHNRGPLNVSGKDF